jgi:adenine-specific DNA-methyltransferase
MPPTGDARSLREQIKGALAAFNNTSLPVAAASLLKALGYTSEKVADLGQNADAFLGSIESFKPELGKFNRDKVFAKHWRSCAFLFQITNDEIPALAIGQSLLVADAKVVRTQIESFVFLAIDLEGDQWSRTALAGIARELNRRFPMPAILLFRHGALFSLAVIDRRASLRDATRDVVESKITVIKDVRLDSPHRAHLDILAGLALVSLAELKEGKRPTNFRQLYEAWIEALSIQALNKRFYTELAWWYYWAVKEVDFPLGGGMDKGKRNSVAVIRLLTRLIFIWFIKEG